MAGTDRIARLASERYGAFLEAVPDAIVGVDPSGRIVLLNTQAEALFGYGRDELLGERVELLVPETARAVHSDHRTAYFANPRTRPLGVGIELAGRRKDGTEFPAEISLSAIETDAGVLVSAAVRDVTERVAVHRERDRLAAQHERDRLEAQLHQSQRLESLGQLAGGVAHDFNNLIAAILSYATFVTDAVIEMAADAGDDRARYDAVVEDVRQITRAAERAARLTHQLLAFGRREVVRPETLELNAVVQDVESLLRRTIGEHVSLVTAYARDLRHVRADRGQIEQVLVNLAVNARDAMTGGGTLSIETSNFDVDEEFSDRTPGVLPGPHVRLRVGDTGVGMDAHVLHHAFDPFFTTKPRGEGSGLGLATVDGIVAQAGGRVNLYSEPGRGTTVTVLLPAVEGAVNSPERGRSAVRRGRGETVLVVEDEDAIREVARRILARNGYEVVTAATGREALEVAANPERSVDLLLTDVVMPGMGGRDVAQQVAALRPGTPVLFMSGYAEPVLTSGGTLDPELAMVSKPFTEPVLLAAVRGALDARVTAEG